MKRRGIAEALRDGIAEEMERDPRVFCMGEDIAVPGGWGGAFTVTLGLEKDFPTGCSTRRSPSSASSAQQSARRSWACGRSSTCSTATSSSWPWTRSSTTPPSSATCPAARSKVPLVMRAPVGATGRGAQHAQSMERYFTGVPGLKVVALSERL